MLVKTSRDIIQAQTPEQTWILYMGTATVQIIQHIIYSLISVLFVCYLIIIVVLEKSLKAVFDLVRHEPGCTATEDG